MRSKCVVIGAGIAGLSAACYLAKAGFNVTVLEKNSWLGGRIRVFEEQGFRFDAGPSWYWMPDIYDQFFGDFGKKVSDYYELVRLDPSYRVFFNQTDYVDIPADIQSVYNLFESFEPGSSAKLKKLLEEAEYKYRIGMGQYARKPSDSLFEYFDWRFLVESFRLEMLGSFGKQIRRDFKHPYLQKILEFPVVFLGATANKIPSLYSLMNYADLELGTWYPKGGMHKIVEAMVSLGKELGVTYLVDQNVQEIEVQSGKATRVVASGETFEADYVVAGADYHFVEQQLLKSEYRGYSENFWDKQLLAPSGILFYLGVKGSIPKFEYNNLFFDEDIDLHSKEIYEEKVWPTKPLLYVSNVNKVDPDSAPKDSENLFVLVLTPAGLKPTAEIVEQYYQYSLDKIALLAGETIKDRIVYRKDYTYSDFVTDFNSYKGNAYGHANTLFQTGPFKPKMRSKKVENLFFCGQMTVPGGGLPPCLMSGEMAARLVIEST